MAKQFKFRVNRKALRSVMDRVYRQLFPRLGAVFPRFGWTLRGGNWVATKWPGRFEPYVRDKRPNRLVVYADRPWTVKVHGHKGVAIIRLVSKAKRLSGDVLLKAIRKLCERAGIPFPEAELAGATERARLGKIAGKVTRGIDAARSAAEAEAQRIASGLSADGTAPAPSAFASASEALELVAPELAVLAGVLDRIRPALMLVADTLPGVLQVLGALAVPASAADDVRELARESAVFGLGLDVRELYRGAIAVEEAKAEAAEGVQSTVSNERLWRLVSTDYAVRAQ